MTRGTDVTGVLILVVVALGMFVPSVRAQSTSTRMALTANAFTITNDGLTHLPFTVTGLGRNVSVVVLLNGPNGTLSESSGTADPTGSYSGSLSYQGPYSGPATLSATDNLGDVSNVLNVTVTQ